MSKIRIYTSNTCPYCKQIKEKFQEKNIEFENKLINEFQEEWQDIISLTGMATVPTVKYMGEYFIPGRDFQNPDQLINMIENYKISPYNMFFIINRVNKKKKAKNYKSGYSSAIKSKMFSNSSS